jgi:hypothetical protein
MKLSNNVFSAAWFRFAMACLVIGSVLQFIGLLPAFAWVPVRAALCGTALASSVAMIVGIRRHRPAHRLPWILLLASVSTNFVATVVDFVIATLMHIDAYPTLADAIWFATYVPQLAGLYLFLRHRAPGKNVAGLSTPPSFLSASVWSAGSCS